MLLALGIIIFIIGCCVSSYEDASYMPRDVLNRDIVN